MINRENLDIVEGYPEIESRKRTSQSEKMASEEGFSQHEREFQRTFFAMSEMVKVLYDDSWNGTNMFEGNLQIKKKVKKCSSLSVERNIPWIVVLSYLG